jgi:hypothetical protein
MMQLLNAIEKLDQQENEISNNTLEGATVSSQASR